MSTVRTKSEDKGKTVNVGVRPEDFAETEGEHIYEGKVDITEALGEVALLYFEAEKNDPVIGKLQGIHSGLRGKSVKMTAEPDRVHLFHEGRSLHWR